MVQNWIEDGRDLTHFTRDDLQDVSSWAMVTEDRIPAIDLFRKVKPEPVQPHTDLFGDKIRVHLWEVKLNRASNHQQLLELAQEGRHTLEIIPLFSERNEPTGTLNPATVTDASFPAQWHLDATASCTQWEIDPEAALRISTDEGVTVAIVDSRQNFNHPDLTGNNNAALDYDDPNRDWIGDPIGYHNPNVFLPGGHVHWPVNGGGAKAVPHDSSCRDCD